MRELQKLGLDIANAVAADEFGERWLSVDKQTDEAAIAHLPDHLRNTVTGLADGVRERVPDDVSWSLSFDEKGTRFAMEYEDGTTGTINSGRFYAKRSKLFHDLEVMNWDDFRRESLQGMDVFDELLSEAEDRPAEIPSSEEAAKHYAAPLEALMTKVKHDRPTMSFVLFMGHREVADVSAVEIAEREGLLRIIADRMTLQDDILAVLENGSPWTFAQIEAAKLEAVEGLGPISRAKAERRFGL